MSFRWDNIEILRAIDRIQGDTYHGGPIQGMSGLQLMEEVNGTTAADQQVTDGFVQELRTARDLGLLTFRVRGNFGQGEPTTNPHWYVQNLWDLALTVAGQDRARGQMITQPFPDPAEDDGRQLSDLIIRQVAASIAGQYATDEVAVFLAEEGIPPVQMPVPVGTGPGDAHAILAALWRWGSEGRRMSRRFLGRWLDGCLLSGPDAELRAALIEQLSQQGWQVRESDSVLVISEPVRGVPVSAPFLRASRLHPLIESEARPPFLTGRPEQGVFASMRAVEIRVRRVAGRGEDVTGVDLMNRAFGRTGPSRIPPPSRASRKATGCCSPGPTPCSATPRAIGRSTTRTCSRPQRPCRSQAS